MRLHYVELSFRAELHKELRHQANVVVPWIIASNAAMASVVIAVLKLL